ncbi:hypothetical protein ACHMWN_06055 [Pedobacter sp. UC225_61]
MFFTKKRNLTSILSVDTEFLLQKPAKTSITFQAFLMLWIGYKKNEGVLALLR